MIENWINKINELSEKAQEKEQLRKIERKNNFKRNLTIIFKPYDLLLKYAGSFIFLVVPYMMLCSLAEMATRYAENVGIIAITYFLFFLIFIAIGTIMMQKWYNVVFLGKNLLKLDWEKSIFAKVFGLNLFFCLLGVLPMISLVVLYNRKVEPNWLFEIFYFTIFFILALIPFLAAKFFVWIAFALEGTALPSFKEVWMKTSIKIILLSYLFMLFVIGICWIQSFRSGDFYDMMWRYFGFGLWQALFVCNISVQKQEFFTSEKNL